MTTLLRQTLVALTLLLTACSGAPTSGDASPRAVEKPQAAPTPLTVARAWITSDDVPAELTTILGERPAIERIWRAGEVYRAVAVGAETTADGDAILLTVARENGDWKVVVAEVGPASALWPAL